MAASFYYINDVFGIKDQNDILTSGICFDIKQKLQLDNLNYYFGTIQDLTKMMALWGKTADKSSQKFPIVWLEMPYTIDRNTEPGLFGKVETMRLFILHATSKTYKPEERYTIVYKTVIHPIYEELLKGIARNIAFNEPYQNKIQHKITDLYYWGEDQSNVLPDVVDVMEIKFNSLKVNIKTC